MKVFVKRTIARPANFGLALIIVGALTGGGLTAPAAEPAKGVAPETIEIRYLRAVKAEDAATREVAGGDEAMLRAKRKVVEAQAAGDAAALRAADAEFQAAARARQKALWDERQAEMAKQKAADEAKRSGVPLKSPPAGAKDGGELRAEDLRSQREPAGIYGGKPNPLGARNAAPAEANGEATTSGDKGEQPAGAGDKLKPLGLNDRFLDDLLRRDREASDGAVTDKLEDADGALRRAFDGARKESENATEEIRGLIAQARYFDNQLRINAAGMTQAQFDEIIRNQRETIEKLKRRGVKVIEEDIPVRIIK